MTTRLLPPFLNGHRDDDPAELAELEALVAADPTGLLCRTPRWLALLRELLPDAEDASIVARRAGRIVGWLPALMFDGPHGRILNSLPYFGSHGGVVAADAGARTALTEAWDWMASDAAAATWVDGPFDLHLDLGAPPTHDLADARIGQLTPLAVAVGRTPVDVRRRRRVRIASAHDPARTDVGPAIAPPVLGSLIDASARRNAAAARRAGVTVRTAPDAIDFLLATHHENIASMGGRPKPRAWFEAISRRFPPIDPGTRGDGSELWLAERHGAPVAALLVVRWNGMVEYLTPATVAEQRSLQPSAAILWEAMTAALARGDRWWNWGGTWLDQEGVHRFKAKWGAIDHPYGYYVRVRQPAILRASPDRLEATHPGFYVAPFRALSVA